MKFLKLLGSVSSFVAPGPATTSPIPGKLDKVGRILENAATLIERRGWTKGHYYGQERQVCLMSAIEVAVTQRSLFIRITGPSKEELVRLAHKRVRQVPQLFRLTGNHYPLHTYNDAAGVGSKDVINVLRQAARN